nr:HAD-IA family hydrolase [Corallococcus exiguus]
MTLLDTSALHKSRDRRDWGYVSDNLHLARPFKANSTLRPHELPAKLRELGHLVAIVTSSPRWYAEALLNRFKVPYDALVANRDTKERKPHPAPLKKALKQLGVKASSTYYVGDTKEDFEASFRAGIRSIGAGWSPGVASLWRTAPDILLYDASLLARPELLPRLGYIAEVRATGLRPHIHQGSVLQCGRRRVALGRYFPSADVRHENHLLTRRILQLKKEDDPARRIGASLALYITKLMKKPPTYVTSVPPKPSQTRNRFVAVISHMRIKVPNVKARLKGMRCLREVGDYKYSAHASRRALVKGAFRSRPTWSNKSVLLVDDVLTSGATTDECTRVLTKSDARVRTACITATQLPFSLHECPRCGIGILKSRSGRFGQFWGCSRYRRGGRGCGYTRNSAPK